MQVLEGGGGVRGKGVEGFIPLSFKGILKPNALFIELMWSWAKPMGGGKWG